LVKTNTVNSGADKVSAESSVSRPIPMVEASDARPDEPPEEEARLSMPPSSEMELPDQGEAQADHVNPVSRRRRKDPSNCILDERSMRRVALKTYILLPWSLKNEKPFRNFEEYYCIHYSNRQAVVLNGRFRFSRAE
jgi:hypothetical protein